MQISVSEIRRFSESHCFSDSWISEVLDPFLFNILPRSLLPTGIYLIVTGIFAWFLSRFIWDSLYRFAHAPTGSKKHD